MAGAVKVPAKELTKRVALRGRMAGAVTVPAKELTIRVDPKGPNGRCGQGSCKGAYDKSSPDGQLVVR